MNSTSSTQTDVRDHRSVLAEAEKRCLVWMAERLPRGINSDHLTALGAAAMVLSGACYAVSPGRPRALAGAILLLAINWFGDSLDGTLARVRHHERPRYGFYVDHVLDVIGVLALVGGLVLGHHMGAAAGAAFLIAYYLLMVEIALATHTVGTFRISYWRFGPTELRILLAVGTLYLLRSDYVTVAGRRWLLFDVGASVAAVGLLGTFVISALRNGRVLYRREPLPGVTKETERPHEKRRAMNPILERGIRS